MPRNIHNAGLSTLEMMIALGYFAITVSALALVSLGNQGLALAVELKGVVRAESEEKVREILLLAETDWPALVSEEGDLGGYKKILKIRVLSPCLKSASSNVSFSDPELARHSYERSLMVGHRASMGELGNDCPAIFVPGDWANPPDVVSEGVVLSGVEMSDADALGRKLFVAVNASSSPYADIAILNLDLMLAGAPALIATLDTGPGLAALDAAGGYVYAANMSRNAQLEIIDVSDPHSPWLVSSLKLPGVYTDATVGQSIFYHNGRVYLGTNKSQIEEFHIIDVSDPASPFELGAYEVGAGVNAIYATGSYVYIATPNPEELTILDVSEPSLITRAGGFDAPMGLGNGKAVSVLGNFLYLGRTVGAREFYVLDVTEPSAPFEVASFDLNSSIYDLKVFDSNIFLATSDITRELQILTFDGAGSLVRTAGHDLSARIRSLDIFTEGVAVADESAGFARVLTPRP